MISVKHSVTQQVCEFASKEAAEFFVKEVHDRDLWELVGDAAETVAETVQHAEQEAPPAGAQPEAPQAETAPEVTARQS